MFPEKIIEIPKRYIYKCLITSEDLSQNLEKDKYLYIKRLNIHLTVNQQSEIRQLHNKRLSKGFINDINVARVEFGGLLYDIDYFEFYPFTAFNGPYFDFKNCGKTFIYKFKTDMELSLLIKEANTEDYKTTLIDLNNSKIIMTKDYNQHVTF